MKDLCRNIIIFTTFAVFLICSSCFVQMERSNEFDKKSDKFVPTVEDPVFSVHEGIYTFSVDLEIKCSTADAEIRYTIDGTEPSHSNGSEYIGNEIPISKDTAVKAIAYKDGYKDSSVVSSKYTITGKVATPDFSPDQGSFEFPETVSITCDNIEAKILYTINGSDPDPDTLSGIPLVNGGTINIYNTKTIKAIAYVEGWLTNSYSDITTKNYTISGSIPVPVFSAIAGTYNNDLSISLISDVSDENVIIKYCLNDEPDPSRTEGTIYTASITVNQTGTTIKAMAYIEDWPEEWDTIVIDSEYTLTTSEPVISGIQPFDNSTTITIDCTTDGTKIRYTMDNSDPTTSSGTLYTGPFEIADDTFVKAIAYKNGYNNSSIPTNQFMKTMSYDWTKRIGGTNIDWGYSIATDLSNNVYITGHFMGTVDFRKDWDSTSDNKSSSGDDIFITKINSNGSYGWTKRMGGSSSEYGRSIALDSSGNIYLTGNFRGTVDFRDDWDSTPDTKTAVEKDIFITKINSNGSYNWTKRIGGTQNDYGYSIALDLSGNAYITGSFQGTVNFRDDWDTTPDTKTALGADIFITKINSNGSYGWSKRMGGNESDTGYSIALDTNGNVYLTGYFGGTVDFSDDWATTPDNKTSVIDYDIFITKIDSDGSYCWTKRMGSSALDKGYSITLDTNGNVYLTGQFEDTVNFRDDWDTTPDVKTSAGEHDIFITKINSSGSYAWTRQMGGPGSDVGYSIALDSNDNVYLIGHFEGTVDFGIDWGISNIKTASESWSDDIFITKINKNGFYGWTKRMRKGGVVYDEGNSITADTSGNVYVTGSFNGASDFSDDWDITPDSKTAAGSYDVFVTKLSSNTTE